MRLQPRALRVVGLRQRGKIDLTQKKQLLAVLLGPGSAFEPLGITPEPPGRRVLSDVNLGPEDRRSARTGPRCCLHLLRCMVLAENLAQQTHRRTRAIA
jgi:hypothetical protein